MAFTTWTDLYEQMLDDLASGQWAMKNYAKGNHSVTFRDLKEFREHLEWVYQQAQEETTTVYGRTCLQPTGRDDRA